MKSKPGLSFLEDWSDLILTPAEVLFLKLGMYRVARRIIEWHYANPEFRPWAKELGLAELCERTGRIREAEEHYKQVIRPGNSFGHLFLGDFHVRQHRFDAAIRSFEVALSLSASDPTLAEQLRGRLEELRRGGERGG